MKLIKASLAFMLTALIVLLSGCAEVEPQPVEKEIFALDTFINLKIYGDNSQTAADLANKRITELEEMLSVTDSNSDVYVVNSAFGKTTVISDDTAEVIKKALEISARTDGAFDISVYPAVKLWGFTTDENHVPNTDEIESALGLVDYKKIQLDGENISLDENMQIDLGAIAKGYIAAQTADIIRESGVESAVLSFGGNIQTVGLKNGQQWQIGIRYPDTSDNFAVLSVGETAIVTSAADQRFFEKDGKRYHHIIDPSTGYPAQSGVMSATVVCSDGAKADALSTALFVMGADRACELYKESSDFEFVVLTDKAVYVSSGLSQNFSLCDGYEFMEIKYVDK